MPVKTIDAATLKNGLKAGEFILVDVREPAEYASEHIEGATLVPLGRVCKAALPDLRNKKLAVHCLKGGRGGTACEKLLAEDPTLDIYNLQGGIGAWKQAGFPIATSGKKILPLDRQVQLTVGLCVLIGSLLAYFTSPVFFIIPTFFGAGLIFAGLSGTCGLAVVLSKMPWNQVGCCSCKHH